MDPLSIGLALAQFAPQLLRYFGVGEKSVAVANTVTEIAKTITGKQNPEEMLKEMQANREFQQQFQLEVNKQQFELEKLYYADVASARVRDTEIRKAGQRNYRADIMAGLAFTVVAAVLAWLIWTKIQTDDFVKATVTLILGRFLGYMDQVFNFEFGTTRSSQLKNETIANATATNAGLSATPIAGPLPDRIGVPPNPFAQK